VNEVGELYSWGSGSKGNLGHELFLDEESPQKIKVLTGRLKVNLVACGEAHTVVATPAGPHAWGWNSCGQLGLGHLNDVAVPTLVEGLKGMEILGLSCGATHTAALVCTTDSSDIPCAHLLL
jgi:alpha-tubulin suppressor-like RCC1 family protein